jgi:hypothetical protein
MGAALYTTTAEEEPFHDLLPHPFIQRPSFKGKKEFKKNLKKSGVIRIAFLRSGMGRPLKRKLNYAAAIKRNEAILDDDAIDYNRALSVEGKAQASRAGKSFGIRLKPYFQDAAVSPSVRGKATAWVFMENAGIMEDYFAVVQEPGKVMIRPVDDLYDRMVVNLAYPTKMDGFIVEGHSQFEKLGDRPLIEYLVPQFPGQKINLIKQILGEYGYYAVERINHICWYDTSQEWGKENKGTFLVVSHKVYLQAAALAAASYTDFDDASKDFIMNARVRPAEGILLNLETKTVELLTRPDTPKEKQEKKAAAAAAAAATSSPSANTEPPEQKTEGTKKKRGKPSKAQ